MIGTVTKLTDRDFVLEMRRQVKKGNAWAEEVEAQVVKLWPEIEGRIREGASVVVEGIFSGAVLRASRITAVR